MGFIEKIKRALKKIKEKIIISIILWIVFAIVFVSPLTYTIHETSKTQDKRLENTINYLSEGISDPLGTLRKNFSDATSIQSFVDGLSKFTVLYAGLVIFAIINAMPKNDYDDIEHGSSDWCENGEQYKTLSNKHGIILSEKNYLPIDKRGNVNVLVVGGSGSGKSASYVIPNAFQLLGSYVFTDPKGELYDKTAGYFKAKGYKVKVLNLVNPNNSDGYNPLMHIKNNIDVDVIANTIVKGQSDGNKQDPFWDDMSEMLLKALIYFLKATRPPEEQNLASCSELVRAANSSGGDNLLTNLINKLPYDHPARMNYKSIEIAPEKTYGSILSSLQSKLGKFDSKEIAELTSTDTIDFNEIGAEKTVVYVISSDTHTAYDFLLTIFFAQMIQQLYDFADENGGALKVPVFFILDEFANIGHIPDFDKKISTSRSRKISFSVILQNLDQLEAVYKDTHETIMGNCDTHLFLGSNSQKTVEYFSKALGEKTITRDSVSINRDKDGWKQGSGVSDQIMARALLTPDELRRLDNDLCIIFEKGLKPIKDNKYYYFKYSTGKLVNKYKVDHNDVAIERGKWRKYNPYNPYVEKEEEQASKDDIVSLDDLFEDDNKPKTDVKPESTKQENTTIQDISQFDLDENFGLDIQEEKKETDKKPEITKEEQELIDIQKELEAKFDELFGTANTSN